MNFNHRYGCQKCTVKGSFEQKTMSFARFNCSPRTDASFRHRHQIEHHKITSPIEILPVDMVSDFPTSDPLHLLELGIMKKCLLRWKDGTKTYKSYLKLADNEKLNEMLSKANTEMPSEIHRSVRSLNCLSDWKGSEYRTFLLYLSIVVLKNLLKWDEYEHFLKFYCAVTICSSDIYRKYVVRRDGIQSLSDCLFNDYIEQYIEIYGAHTISSNVHNLAHVTDDVIRFGNLNNISTYPYENRLGMLKNKLKKCNKPLEQIARRVAEIKLVIENESNSAPASLNERTWSSFPKLKDSMRSHRNSFSTIIFQNSYRLSTKKFGDKWFLIKATGGTRIIEMTRVVQNQTHILIFGKTVCEKLNFFETPFSSSKISIYISNGETDEELSYSLDSVVCKMVCLTYQRKFIFIPLVHTFTN